MLPFVQHLVDVFFRRTVIMIVDLSVFQKSIFCEQLFKTGIVCEIIIDPVDFSRSRLTGRHGNGILDIGKPFAQGRANRPLPGSGRAGYNDEQSGIIHSITPFLLPLHRWRRHHCLPIRYGGKWFPAEERQDDPAVIHDDDGPRLAAKGRVDEVVSVSGILDKALDWSRLRADHATTLSPMTTLPKPIFNKLKFIIRYSAPARGFFRFHF